MCSQNSIGYRQPRNLVPHTSENMSVSTLIGKRLLFIFKLKKKETGKLQVLIPIFNELSNAHLALSKVDFCNRFHGKEGSSLCYLNSYLISFVEGLGE